MHHNKTELDDTEGQVDTVETIIEAFGTYRSTLPAPARGAMMRPCPNFMWLPRRFDGWLAVSGTVT